MPLFTDASQQFRQMDRFSCGNTGIHRLDARIKIGAFLVYQICVLSWPPQEITGLLPFFLFPVCVIRLAGLPLGYLLKRTLWLLPVAVMIGLFNPLVDRTPMGEWFGIPVTQGMISFISIILRCMLTILGAFTLLASTGFAPLCRGLRQLGAPRILITLMTFLYRYVVNVLGEEPTTDGDLSIFKDAGKISDYAKEAMAWGAAAGLLEGYGDGTVGPKNPVTRAQMAKFLTILSKAF